MIKIALFISIILFVLFLVLKFKDDEKVSNTTLIKMLLLVLSMVGLHQYQTNQIQDEVTSLLNSYKSGKTLICKDREISQKNYTYQSGTMVFLSKKETIDKFPIQDCKLKE